jgi:heme a synthase
MTDITQHMPLSRSKAALPSIGTWLGWVAFMVLLMVIVGGATRLTNSGLSITEWDPVFGAIPPMNAADWDILFQKYQQSSQYKLQNAGMSLTQFQFIFWWEWAHRLLGRLIGFVFLIPFLYFLVMRKLELRLVPRLVILFVLGGLQGALGWYMVSSGLVNRVDVSQYRLAAHLTLASVLFAAIIWTISSLKWRHKFPRNFDAWTALILFLLVLLQIAAGGFVAGLDAGQGYNTWPLMDGKYIPDGLSAMQPVWHNVFENALTVQFDHRILAYVIFVIAVMHAVKTFSFTSMVLCYLVFVQAGLGIMTLLMHIPLGFALAHQATAMLVLAAAVWNLHKKTIDQVLVDQDIA